MILIQGLRNVLDNECIQFLSHIVHLYNNDNGTIHEEDGFFECGMTFLRDKTTPKWSEYKQKKHLKNLAERGFVKTRKHEKRTPRALRIDFLEILNTTGEWHDNDNPPPQSSDVCEQIDSTKQQSNPTVKSSVQSSGQDPVLLSQNVPPVVSKRPAEAGSVVSKRPAIYKEPFLERTFTKEPAAAQTAGAAGERDFGDGFESSETLGSDSKLKVSSQDNSDVIALCKQFSEKLFRAASSVGYENKKASLSKWAKEFALLSEQVSLDEISDVLNWYCEKGISEKYCKTATTAKTFREKFKLIQNYKNENSQTIPHADALPELTKRQRSKAHRLFADYGHLLNGDISEFEKAVSQSLVNFGTFVEVVERLLSEARKNHVWLEKERFEKSGVPGFVMNPGLRRYEIILENIQHLNFVETWHYWVLKDVEDWDGWKGRIKDVIFSKTHPCMFSYFRDAELIDVFNTMKGVIAEWLK